MKKVFTYLAIASLALLACQKEAAIEKDNAPANISNNIPTEIVCEISETQTKTQYAGNTTFGWSQNDVVRMPVKNGSNQWNYFSFTTTEDSGNPSATFIRNGGSDNMETYNPSSPWTNCGYLLYPTSIFDFSGTQNNGVWNSGDYPVVNLPSAIAYTPTNPLDGGVVPLIGRKVGESYLFATAVGFLKITVCNIPANLATVKLVSTTNCISGKFAVSHSTTNYLSSDVAIAQVATSATGFNDEGTKELTLNVTSLTEGVSYDFYFPLPVGTYDASSLSLKLKTQDGETVKVISKTIAKPITITRNEILDIPDLTLSAPKYSVAVNSSGTSSPQLSYVNDNAASRYLRICVRSSAEHLLSEYVNGQRFTNIPANITYGLIGAKNVSDDYSLSGSGDYYLHYIILTTSADLTSISPTLSSLDDNRIVEYGTIPFSYSQALSDIFGTYVRVESTNHLINWVTGSGVYENSTFQIIFEELSGADTSAPDGTNVKITRIGSVSGVAYGTYDGINTVTFTKGQIFNTFDEIEVNEIKYDRNSFIGLIGGTWYDPSFTIVRNGTLIANQTYLVLRNTNEALWASEHTEGRGNPYGGGKWSGYSSTVIPFTVYKQ